MFAMFCFQLQIKLILPPLCPQIFQASVPNAIECHNIVIVWPLATILSLAHYLVIIWTIYKSPNSCFYTLMDVPWNLIDSIGESGFQHPLLLHGKSWCQKSCPCIFVYDLVFYSFNGCQKICCFPALLIFYFLSPLFVNLFRHYLVQLFIP
jgi:hypothetical protein